MKLFFVLAIIAYGYADKLDRAYLPPANAASSGGSPGSLIAPGVQPEAFGQGLPVAGLQPGLIGFGKPSLSQNGVSDNTKNSAGNVIVGNAFNPSSGSDKPVVHSRQQFSSNEFSGSKQNVPGSPSTSGSFNQGFGPKDQGINGIAQVYNQERPQAAADRNAEILKYINDNNGESYSYSYETSNGISGEESGIAINGVMARGGYAYTGDDGKVYSVRYTADENGYQPQGEHLPTPHPIPEEILKSIEENAKAAAAGVQEGAYHPEEYESEVSPQQYNIGSDASYQSKPGQEQSQGFPANQEIREQNLQIDRSGQNFPNNQQDNKGIVSGQGLRTPNQGEIQRNNQGFIQESNQNYRPRLQEQSFEQSAQSNNQLPNRGSANQNAAKLPQGQGNGYHYNQPENGFQSSVYNQAAANKFVSGPSASGSVLKGNRDNFKDSLGSRPSTDLYRPEQSQPQIGLGQQIVSVNRPLPESESNRVQNQITSFVKQNQENQNIQPFRFQQSNPAAQGYQYQPKQPSLPFNTPNIINNSGSHNKGISNQPSFNSNKQNQELQSSFYQSSNPQIQQSVKQPSIGAFSSTSQNSRIGAPVNNQAAQSYQFAQNANQPSFNYNQAPKKILQYQQPENQPSFGNRQPVQESQSPSGAQGLGANNLGKGPASGSRPVQAPYQYNKPNQSFNTEPQNFLPLESQPSEGRSGQGNQDRSEEFGGPRQPPSFSSQEVLH